MLEALTSKKVSLSNEGLTVVCLRCLLNLKLAYNFQQKVKKCEEKFTNRLQIKQELYTLQPESVSINENGDIKTDQETYKDLVKLCDNNCAICGFQIEDNLINDHVRKHFSEQQNCDLCDVSFSSVKLYRQHLLQHPPKVHQCSNCGAKFHYKSFYETHIKTVCLTKSAVLDSRISALGLQSKEAIKVLLDSKHKRKKPYALDEINDEDAKRQVFKLGLRSSKAIKVLLAAEKGEDHTCTVCFKKFSSRKTFLAHTHRTKKCNICNRDVSEHTYKRHVEDHTLGPQVCHLCGATLQNKSSLVTHIFYSHNNLRYKCDECGKLFKKRNARDLHIRKDHIGKPSHYCDTCGKGFYTGKFLQKHIKMTHLKLRPHICDFCNRGFSSHYALKTHRRQHTNETPYRCEICGDGFRQNVSLKAHRKSKHNIIEPKTCDCKVCGKGFASDVALYAHRRLH
ncbi:hypothetical protein BDFB_008183 [Asbolus verrucosus]|uniref:C2H2-type domain-containing protein n=1 Tax=Asbolus verrucosus TaxID=1661398 RepID=A0A482VDL5_ASBVE|nr:hypothetical protein BDFB_008183 [Asbolus verrucosus]